MMLQSNGIKFIGEIPKNDDFKGGGKNIPYKKKMRLKIFNFQPHCE